MKNFARLLIWLFLISAAAVPAFGEPVAENVSLYVGQTLELRPFLLTEDILKEGKAAWRSIRPEVASVSSSGVITGQAPGETIIIASMTSGNNIKEAQVKVTVKTAIESVSLSESQYQLVAGQELTLRPMIKPVSGLAVPYLTAVTWKSGNEKIAKVDANGKVTGISAGKTVVYASAKDGGHRGYCEIEVIHMVKSLSVTPIRLDLDMGDGAQLTATVLPENALVKKLTYKSNNAAIATVSDTGYVSAKGVGETQILITTVDGGKAELVPVKVNTMTAEIKLDKTLLELDEVNNKYKLQVTFVPKNPAKPVKVTDVKWKSSNNSVVSVDANGLVTGLKTGQAAITATSADGGFTAQCTVRSVVTGVSGGNISISQIKLINPPTSLYAGQSATIAYQVFPDNASVRKVSVKANPPAFIAPVIDFGQFTITPTKVGTHVFTAYSEGASTEFQVDVKPSVKNLEIAAPSLDKSGEAYVLYLGQRTLVQAVYDLSGLSASELAAKTVKWESVSKDLKVEQDPSDPSKAWVTLLSPTNAYLEASMLEGTVKHRINFRHEPMAKTMTMADQAQINLGYNFKPEISLEAKPELRYGYTQVISSAVELYLQEVYIDTEFLRREIDFEKENIPALKALADRLGEGAEKSRLLTDWNGHIQRKIRLEAILKSEGQEYQRVTSLNELSDRNLKKLSFFEIKDGSISSLFAGKALLRVVSKDSGLQKNMWITARNQAEDLILLDQAGNIIASSSDEAKKQLKAREEALKKAALDALKAKFKLTKGTDLPSDAYLEAVGTAIGLKLVDEAAYKGSYQKTATQLDLLTLLVKAYDLETGKTAKKVTTRYFANVKNDTAERAYQLGLISGNSTRHFEASEPVTAKMLAETFAKWLKATKTAIKAPATLPQLVQEKEPMTREAVIQRVLNLTKAN